MHVLGVAIVSEAKVSSVQPKPIAHRCTECALKVRKLVVSHVREIALGLRIELRAQHGDGVLYVRRPGSRIHELRDGEWNQPEHHEREHARASTGERGAFATIQRRLPSSETLSGADCEERGECDSKDEEDR